MHVFVIDGKICRADDEDAHLIKEYSWCLNKGKLNYTPYIMFGRRVGRRVEKTYLHRLVLGAAKGDRVVFLSSDTLDCRKSNLRLLRGRRADNVEVA